MGKYAKCIKMHILHIQSCFAYFRIFCISCIFSTFCTKNCKNCQILSLLSWLLRRTQTSRRFSLCKICQISFFRSDLSLFDVNFLVCYLPTSNCVNFELWGKNHLKNCIFQVRTGFSCIFYMHILAFFLHILPFLCAYFAMIFCMHICPSLEMNVAKKALTLCSCNPFVPESNVCVCPWERSFHF